MRGLRTRVNSFWRSSVGRAFQALQRRTDERRAPFWRRHPWTDLPRRIVADMLRVAALQIRHPMSLIVLMEADDSRGHAADVIRQTADP